MIWLANSSRLHPGLLGAPDEVLGELVLLDGELLLLGERVEDELGLHGLLGALRDLGGELLVGLALALERRTRLSTPADSSWWSRLARGRRPRPSRRLGQRDVDELVQLLDELVASLRALLVAAAPARGA